MYHGCKTMSEEIGDDDVIDDIIKSKSRSTFWTAVTLLIFKLERWTNAQNVGNWTGYFDVILISKHSQSLQFSLLCYELSSFRKFWQVRNLRLLFHLFVCLCLYDVCPDDLTMKDWCHTSNILQVHCWGCLVVQVMFHGLITSSMTSPGHKVGHILKVIYLR